MALLVITPPTTTAREVSLLPPLFRSGLRALHVRKPGASREDLQDYISNVPSEFRDRLVLHQHHELASAGLRGVHYPQRDLPSGSITAPAGLTVSISLHQLRELGVCRGQVDYYILAPIFNSISKASHRPSAELADRAALSSSVLTSRAPVIALGGVTPATFPQLAEWGFAGAALLGAIWEAADPVAALEESLGAFGSVAWNADNLSCSTT